MKTQKMQKANKPQINRARKARIKHALYKNNVKQKDIASALDITESAVSRFILGKQKSKRISGWFKDNLNLKV